MGADYGGGYGVSYSRNMQQAFRLVVQDGMLPVSKIRGARDQLAVTGLPEVMQM